MEKVYKYAVKFDNMLDFIQYCFEGKHTLENSTTHYNEQKHEMYLYHN